MWGGLADWGQLLHVPGWEPVRLLTKSVLGQIGTQRQQDSPHQGLHLPAYAGFHQTFYTREVGGVVSMLAYAPPGLEMPPIAVAGEEETLNNAGRIGDQRPGDSFRTYSLYAMLDPGKETIQVPLDFGNGHSWPYLTIEGDAADGDLHQYLTTEIPKSLKGESATMLTMEYPQLGANFMGIYQRNLGGRPVVLAAGFGRQAISGETGGLLRFEAAVSHPYGLERVAEAILSIDGEEVARLNDRGESGDRLPYDGIFSTELALLPGAPAQKAEFALAITDDEGNRSDPWPSMVVHQGGQWALPSDEALPVMRDHLADNRPPLWSYIGQRWTGWTLPLILGLLSGVWWLRRT